MPFLILPVFQLGFLIYLMCVQKILFILQMLCYRFSFQKTLQLFQWIWVLKKCFYMGLFCLFFPILSLSLSMCPCSSSLDNFWTKQINRREKSSFSVYLWLFYIYTLTMQERSNEHSFNIEKSILSNPSHYSSNSQVL